MTLKEFYSALTHKEKLDFAEKIGASYYYLSHLANGNKVAGTKYLTAIPRVTNGLVTEEELRPELHGKKWGEITPKQLRPN
jgi:DNA-binding transcriptional regulator YdaS (Cro superfamily)